MNFDNIISIFKLLKKFIFTDIWKITLHKQSKYFRLFVIQLRIIIISFKGIFEDRIQQRASALSFYSLMSIVPIFAILFGVAKATGLEQFLNKFIYGIFEGQDAIIEPIISITNHLLSSTKSGLMTGFGSIILLLTIIKLIQNIELSFNDIWHITKKRTILNRLKNILLIILIAPILILISSTINIIVSGNLQDYFRSIEFFKPILMMISKILSFSYYVIMWIFFSLLYFILPNIKVRLKTSVYAGIFTGTIFNLLQWGYVTFQIGVTNQNVIYGSFAAIPLFLTWMQLSWFIVLIGAKVAYAIDNYEGENNQYSKQNYSSIF